MSSSLNLKTILSIQIHLYFLFTNLLLFIWKSVTLRWTCQEPHAQKPHRLYSATQSIWHFLEDVPKLICKYVQNLVKVYSLKILSAVSSLIGEGSKSYLITVPLILGRKTKIQWTEFHLQMSSFPIRSGK